MNLRFKPITSKDINEDMSRSKIKAYNSSLDFWF